MTDHDSETPTGEESSTKHVTEETYRLTVRREFIAQHFLTVPNPGLEGEVHSHEFTAELVFAGPELGEYGYLVDIDTVEAALDGLEARYRDALLNDLPEFGDANPSVERFARLFGDRLVERLGDTTPTRLTVRMWEDDLAWASHERVLE
ncbi:MAG: 6-carboxytetrahydropterin synthase [Halolamina sp.]|uniref:6-pyruvoyl trahydropterin synthase family protein n=1 Tax=Halolamina sp. TaxID=1940283 RepID=UPI002FC2C0B4